LEIILQSALKYQEMGFSIIPIQRNKKPYVAWEKYQKEKADPDLIKEWWRKWPNANVAIVTGKISGINVVDIDSKGGMNEIDKLLPDTFETPIASTPGGGFHYYFKSTNGLQNAVRFINDCDFRGEGGYIIAPPSKGYKWYPYVSIFELTPGPIPQKIEKALKNNTVKPSNISIGFNQGARDDTLFHIALSMAKGGMPEGEVAAATIQFAKSCNPPFSEREALIKVKSAFEHLGNKENLIQEMREWIQGISGIFSNKQLMEELDIPKAKKGHVSKYLNRLVGEGLIIKVGGKYGNWRRVEEELQRITLKEKVDHTVGIKLGFGLDDMVETRPGNLIAIAGIPNAGKTSYMFNMAASNMYKFKCHYFTSEMGQDELTMRLSKFKDVPWEDWDKYLNAYSRTENFADVIRPGKGNINFIDYIEMADEFYKIGGYLKEIHNKLNGAIAIIALQKNPGTDVARGGFGSLEKPRLYLAIDPGRMKIVKAKNWRGKVNPNGLEMSFKLHNGTEFQQTSAWRKPEPKKRDK